MLVLSSKDLDISSAEILLLLIPLTESDFGTHADYAYTLDPNMAYK